MKPRLIRMHSSSMRTTCSLPYGGSLSGRSLSRGSLCPGGSLSGGLCPVDRMTDASKNIILPQTSFAGGNNGLTIELMLGKVSGRGIECHTGSDQALHHMWTWGMYHGQLTKQASRGTHQALKPWKGATRRLKRVPVAPHIWTLGQNKNAFQ